MKRSDDDSWDLASSVGATATMVAAGRALASKSPNALINDPWAQPLVRAVGLDFFTKQVEGRLDTSGVDPQSIARMQVMIDEVAVRTKFYDDYFLEATADGARQVVILAAGLDARAYRLRWPPTTVVYEIDQPAVIEFKTRTLADLGAAPTADRRTVAMDLRGDWPAGLRAAGFDSSMPTSWAAEGLLMYLPQEAQRHLVAAVTDLSASGSTLAADHRSEPVKADVSSDDEVETWRERGFDIDMAELMFVDEPSRLEEFLAERDWRVEASRTRNRLFAEYDMALPAGADDVMGGLDYLTAMLPN